jgi:hypothetical protein
MLVAGVDLKRANLPGCLFYFLYIEIQCFHRSFESIVHRSAGCKPGVRQSQQVGSIAHLLSRFMFLCLPLSKWAFSLFISDSIGTFLLSKTFANWKLNARNIVLLQEC